MIVHWQALQTVVAVALAVDSFFNQLQLGVYFSSFPIVQPASHSLFLFVALPALIKSSQLHQDVKRMANGSKLCGDHRCLVACYDSHEQAGLAYST